MKPRRTETRAACGAVCGQFPLTLVCDRDFGHLGEHRGYLAAHDAAVFWRGDARDGPTEEPREIRRPGGGAG